MRRPALGILLLFAASCAARPNASFEFATCAPLEPWPAADALFQRDPRWICGDAAYSVDLGADRILWLFGDSFIAKSSARSRVDAWFIHNSIAIQSGSRDPSMAAATFAWKTVAGEAASFFEDEGERWVWPLSGIRLKNRLLLFLLEEEREPEGLGFQALRTKVVAIDNADDEPNHWRLTDARLPSFRFPLALGAAVFADGPYVYAFAVREPGDHSVYVTRFDAETLDAGDASAPEFLVDGAWRAPSSRVPDVIFPSRDALDNPPTELSVQKRANGTWLAVYSSGFGASRIVERTAPTAVGPWGPSCALLTPLESGSPGVLVYAAKAHPELAGGKLVVTYATNAAEPARLVHDMNLYFPRFARVAGPLQR